MQIAGYLRTSLIEWPGKIASVIFVPGCNFACPFCHNRDLVDPKRSQELPAYKEEEILTDLESRKKWIDGVVITGGEPTLQPDLAGFLKRAKKAGFATMIETNGSRQEVLERLLRARPKVLDFVAMDYKTTFTDYAKVVGRQSSVTSHQTTKRDDGQSETIKKSMGLILSSKIPFEFRTTVVPTIHDEKALVQMAKDLKKLSVINWVLQPFRPKNCLDPKFSKLNPFTESQMEKFLKAVQKIIPGARLKG